MHARSIQREKRIEMLLAGYYVDTLTPAQAQELVEYWKRRPVLRKVMKRLDDIELVKEHLTHYDQGDQQIGWAMLQAKIAVQAIFD